MKLVEESVLHYVLKNKKEDFLEEYYVAGMKSSLDRIDIEILQLIATGVCRKRFSSILSCAQRTVENRLRKMRLAFGCNNTSHLIAVLSVVSMRKKSVSEMVVN